MNFPLTMLKATFISTIVFWAIIISEDTVGDTYLLILLSLIPIFLSCLAVITITIAPFFWFKKESLTNSQMVKKYFPFYAIAAFGICSYGIVATGFDIYILAFFTSAFFTTMLSWIWFLKHSRK